jgi:hypothetical protein
MTKTLITASVIALMSGAAFANPLSFGLDTEYTSTEGVSDTSLTVTVDGSFGDVFIAGVDADVEAEDLTGFYVGANLGSTVLTYGEQDGVFSYEGGLNAISGNVLAAPSAAERSLNLDGLYGLGVSVGLDTGSDVQNIQVTGEVAGFSLGIDYDVNAEDYILGAAYSVAVAADLTVGGIATYNDALAGELHASYATLGGSVNSFTSLNEDGFDTVGLGYDRNLSDNASIYVEGGRDLNTDDNTIAMGLAFSF